MTGRRRTLGGMTTHQDTAAPVRSTGWLTALRSTHDERRRARAARRALETELATYRTPAEVQDLFAALRTQDDNPMAEEMRSVLFANLEQQHTRAAA